MTETFQTQYQAIPNMEGGAVPGKKFFVYLAGETNGAHLEIIDEFRKREQREVGTVEESDYVLLICPITSRIGTDISEALQRAPDQKPLIIVVMHHTFNAKYTLVESRRQVQDPKVRLVVDCLFYNGHLIDSQINDNARFKVKTFLRTRPFEHGKGEWWSGRHVKMCAAIISAAVLVTIVIVVITESLKKY